MVSSKNGENSILKSIKLMFHVSQMYIVYGTNIGAVQTISRLGSADLVKNKLQLVSVLLDLVHNSVSN